MVSIGRRQFLTTGALAAGGALLATRIAFAQTQSSSRFVLIVMRGALDGLAAVPPYGDPDYAGLRRELALPAPGTPGGALRLDGVFALHPSLQFMHECYSGGELAVLHAVASPYRERSHFDGQDVLENGCAHPHAAESGWLNRALAAMPADRVRKELGVALGQNVPLVMRGSAQVASWSPSRLASLDEDTLQRITDLYSSDPLLSHRLADALAANEIATTAQSSGMMDQPHGSSSDMTSAAPAPLPAPLTKPDPAAGAARYVEVVRATAGFLRSTDGPRVAVFDTTGWDTHANEGGGEGQLAARLAALDTGLRTLREQLGPAWRDTAVLAITEFGRTAAVNGTRGTDHGTAAAAFLLGGAVAGGRVIADWPGLAAGSLYQGRDLRPTLELHSVLKGLLAEHLQIPERALANSVFPDSVTAKPLRGLIRS